MMPPISRLADGATTIADRGLLEMYRQLRRAAGALFAALPLLLLLVGSCKLEDLPEIFSGDADTQFRAALLPETPAPAHVRRARDYIAAHPDALLRLGAREVEGIWGAPDLNRREAQARIWQYRAGDCVADIYIYDGQVRHADVRGENCAEKISRAAR